MEAPEEPVQEPKKTTAEQKTEESKDEKPVKDVTGAEQGEGAKNTNEKKEEKAAAGGEGDRSTLAAMEPGAEYDALARTLQTSPPSILVSELWNKGAFPVGEVHEYRDNNMFRTTAAEVRERDRIMSGEWELVREAAECHRQVRKWAQTQLKPGCNLYNLCEGLEALNRKLVGAKGLERGIAFPTGVSRNHVAAHYSPNPGDRKEILKKNDIIKIDFGTQVNGHIVDCAWTYTPNPERYGPLIEAVRAATETGIREAGIDARLADIGAAIQETMESHEIELDGKVYAIKSIANLNGHSISPYRIHAGKSVPIVKGTEERFVMEEGEHYAIETFGSTGKGRVVEDLECSHYMKNWDAGHVPLRTKQAKSLFAHIRKNYGTLAFCKRFLAHDGVETFDGALSQLCRAGLVNAYPPLCDKAGSYTAQFEHTILLRPTCKEVVSRGDDY